MKPNKLYEACTGMVFNIQHFSLHDGPGIRTVVFFKGCPLRCPWCANPESQRFTREITWDKKKCRLCLHCVQQYPQVFQHRQGEILVDQLAAQACGSRLDPVDICLYDALDSEGEEKSAGQIIREVCKDKAFYSESGGGITLSGGEVLAQPEFALAILRLAKESGLHRAAETTCYTTPAVFREFLAEIDYLLFDVKHFTDQKHRSIVGVPLPPITENIRLAVASGKDILARIPLVPGFNDTLADVDGFAAYFQEVGIKKVQLLPFHQFGENKYRTLHRSYAFTGVDALHKEDLQEHARRFAGFGIECMI